jgi:very-short-patch-repair endonuclease
VSVSKAEELLDMAMLRAGLYPEREHFFTEARRWRFDFAWPEIKLAIEVQGAGAHQRFGGQGNDMEKINAAIEDGWRVLQYPADRVANIKRRKRIVAQIKRTINGIPDPWAAGCVLKGEPKPEKETDNGAPQPSRKKTRRKA